VWITVCVLIELYTVYRKLFSREVCDRYVTNMIHYVCDVCLCISETVNGIYRQYGVCS